MANTSLAHQYIGQLDEDLTKAIFGNVSTIIAFPIGAKNGEMLGKDFYPEFKREDLTNHDKYHIYLKLAIDGKSSKSFSALTLPPFFKFERQGNKDKIIEGSRMRYSSKKDVDEKIGKVKIPFCICSALSLFLF